MQRVHPLRVSAAGVLEVQIAADPSLPSDTYNVRSQPQLQQAGMSSGGVAWQSRKRAATDAIKERQQPQRQPPPPASPNVITAASPQQPATTVMRQPQLGAFFSAAGPRTQTPDSMDTD